MKKTPLIVLLFIFLLTACASGSTDLPALPQEGYSPRTLYNLDGLETLIQPIDHELEHIRLFGFVV